MKNKIKLIIGILALTLLIGCTQVQDKKLEQKIDDLEYTIEMQEKELWHYKTMVSLLLQDMGVQKDDFVVEHLDIPNSDAQLKVVYNVDDWASPQAKR